MSPTIDHAELEARQSRARRLMLDRSLNALFITDPGNLFYFTGYPVSAERCFPRPTVFILPKDQDSVLIAHDFYFPFPWQGKLTLYDQIGALPCQLVHQQLIQRNLGRARIGAELGHEQHLAISHQDFLTLQRALPSARFVDASSLLWQLRSEKTDSEVALIRHACVVADSIFARCFGTLEIGMTTSDVERLFQLEALRAGGKHSGAIVCIGAFEPSQAAGSSPAEKRLEPGMMCWVDFSLGWQGYRTDYCRAVVAGEPSEQQLDTWNKVNEVLLAGERAAKPGRPISEICRAELNCASDHGLDMSTWMAQRYGHSSGIHTTEPPSVSLEDATTLAPNMVVHLEPGVIGHDGIYVREEMIVITETGCERLSNAPWELQTV